MKDRWKYALAASVFAGLLSLGNPGSALAADGSGAAVQQNAEQKTDSSAVQSDQAAPAGTNTDNSSGAAAGTATDTSAGTVTGAETGTASDTAAGTATGTATGTESGTDLNTGSGTNTAETGTETPGTGTETPSGTDPETPSGTDPETPSGTDPETPSGTDPEKPEFEKTIESGVYVISSALNGFKMLDVANASKADAGNVQIYEANGTDAQKYEVTWNEDGYYTIKNQNSGKYLDAAWGGTKNGTNVQQYEGNGTDAQKWFIVRKGNDFFSILNKLSMKAIDIKWGETGNGTNVWLYDSNETEAQKFRFLRAASGAELTDGVYVIATALDQNKVMDISGGTMMSGGNLQLYQKNDTEAQRFILSGTGGGTYRLTSLVSGQTIDLMGGSKNIGTNIFQYSNNNRSSQRWYIRQTGDGTCYIVPAAATDNAVDVACAKTANGTNIYSYAQNGTDAQKFYFRKVSYTPVTGEFCLNCFSDHNMTLDIENGNRQMQANVQIYQSNGTNAQKFYIEDKGNGFVIIKNVKSKHLLDVAGGSQENSANVQQYRDNGTWAQMWIEHANGDGSYTFVNANSSKVLEVLNGTMRNGTNVKQYEWNGTNGQKFFLTPTTGSDNEAIDYSVYRPLDDTDQLAQSLYSDTRYAILVDTGRHVLSVYSGYHGNWDRIGRWAVGDGYYTATPRGSFRIYGKTLHFGEEHGYSCWYTSMFYGSFYLHSVTCYPYTFTPDSANQTGRAVSHGCVRMDINNAKWIYDNCPIGTRVYVFR